MTVSEIRTYQKCCMVSVTSAVRDILKESGMREGVVVVYCPHTTAGMTINENADPDVVRDLLQALDALTPDIDYQHAEGNSPAHLKASFMGSSVTIPVRRGELALGTWQGIYFCEFDGPRTRRFIVQTISAD